RTLVDARAATLGRAPTQGDLEPVTWDRYYTSSETAADYARALVTLHRATRELAAFQEQWDVILTPMLAQPPMRLGEIVHSGPNAAYFADRVRAFSPFSAMATGRACQLCRFHSIGALSDCRLASNSSDDLGTKGPCSAWLRSSKKQSPGRSDDSAFARSWRGKFGRFRPRSM